MGIEFNDPRLESLIVGIFYASFAGITFITNMIISEIYYFSLLTLYAGTTGNFLGGVGIVISSILGLKNIPVSDEEKYKMGIAKMSWGGAMLICLIISILGIDFQYNLWYLIVNFVFILLILPIFIVGLLFFIPGVRSYRKYRVKK